MKLRTSGSLPLSRAIAGFLQYTAAPCSPTASSQLVWSAHEDAGFEHIKLAADDQSATGLITQREQKH